MTIEIKHDDILNGPELNAVIPVNCVGIMGAGLALQFKEKYPDQFKYYKMWCEDGLMHTGDVPWVSVVALGGVLVKRYFLFPTKMHWKDRSKIQYIQSGLTDLEWKVNKIGATEIAFPKLGCGLGGLKWEHVKPLIEEFSEKVPGTKVVVYE